MSGRAGAPGTGIDTDLCVIGGGSGGLSVAAGAVQMGARVVLIERGAMGGDCLNVGCVPSKSLIAAAAAAHQVRQAGGFGVRIDEPDIDFAGVHRHIRSVIDTIAPHDSVDRFLGLGVTVIQAAARFIDARTVEAGRYRITARRIVIATGSRPLVPPIPGLDTVDYLTNETIFDLEAAPRRLAIIGGGAIGAELAQAYARLGVGVTLFEQATVLNRESPSLVVPVRQALLADGVDLHEKTVVTGAAAVADGIEISYRDEAGPASLTASHLLVAVGRRPTVSGLDLDRAGVEAGPAGIRVDRRLRTSNRRIFAIGDVTGIAQFTHAAGHHAGIVIRNALFRLPAKVSPLIPRVTFCDPELAQIGPTPEELAAAGRDVEMTSWPFQRNDRALAERRTAGEVQVAVGRRGRIEGVGIVGPGAGDLLAPWILAMERKLKLSAMAGTVLPYPTLAEVSKQAAGGYYAPRLYSPRARGLVRLLLRLGW